MVEAITDEAWARSTPCSRLRRPTGDDPSSTRADQAAERLCTEQVGGFFTNTVARPRLGARCAPGRRPQSLCPQCVDLARDATRTDLADQVVHPGLRQGQHGPAPVGAPRVPVQEPCSDPSAECQRDLQVDDARRRRSCTASASRKPFGWWDDRDVRLVCQNRPGVAHPVVELARAVAPRNPEPARVLLDVGPDIWTWPRGDHPLPRRFAVSDRCLPEGRRVDTCCVVDDTWVSGDKPQSAALALRGWLAREPSRSCA